jgi:hypothetical protein
MIYGKLWLVVKPTVGIPCSSAQLPSAPSRCTWPC